MIIRCLLCVAICVVIWVVNGKDIIHAIRERFASEFYMHIGLSIFFTLLTLELIIGKLWLHFDAFSLKIIGWILCLPSAYLVAASHIVLTQKGKPEVSNLDTTILVSSGIYRIIRQPMTLGMVIWSVALILVFQSVFSVVLGVCSVFCFWMSARKEAEYNIKKLGERYTEYLKEVPMWNIFRGIRK